MKAIVNFYTEKFEYHLYTDFRDVENFGERIKEIKAGYDKIQEQGLEIIEVDTRENVLVAVRPLNSFELDLIKWYRIYHALNRIECKIESDVPNSFLLRGEEDLREVYKRGLDAIVKWYIAEVDEGYEEISRMAQHIDKYKLKFDEYTKKIF